MNNYTYKNAPLADRSRPSSFDEMVGQAHLIGKNGALRALVASGRIPSMVFFGPPGCGKTTAASIIASLSGMELRCLNATTAALADIRKIADEADSVIGQGGILLYLDEIQYFNKKQQQSLLEYIEDGRITLISSTTENPYYYIYDALLSRLSVFEFKPVTASDIIPRLRAVFEESGESALSFTGEAYAFIAGCAGGDVRRALTMLELSVNCAKGSGTDTVDEEFVRSLTPSVAAGQFDADGDVHYDLLSALQKSIRGSDPDAAVHYLGRLLEAGDLLSPCRRLLVIACEDIGLAYPQAIPIVKACVDSALQLGLPEAKLPLAEACILLATAPKSNSACMGIDAALADVRAGRTGSIPRELQNVHADGAGFEREQGYKYPHSYPGHWVRQQYLPYELRGAHYYDFGDNKTEQAAKRYWEEIKK